MSTLAIILIVLIILALIAGGYNASKGKMYLAAYFIIGAVAGLLLFMLSVRL